MWLSPGPHSLFMVMGKKVPVNEAGGAGPGLTTQTFPGTRSLFAQGSEKALSEDAALFTRSGVASPPPAASAQVLSHFISCFILLFFYTLTIYHLSCLCVPARVLHCSLPLGHSAFSVVVGGVSRSENKLHTHVEAAVMSTNLVSSWCPWKQAVL